MKHETHPKYYKAQVTCSCGNTFEVGATVETMRVEICSACHPFYTGNQKLVDTAGRVERFQERMAKAQSGKADKKTKTDSTKQVETNKERLKAMKKALVTE